MVNQDVFERYRHIPGEDTSIPFVVIRNGKREKACYYFYSFQNQIKITQVCFVKKDGSTDLIKLRPELFVETKTSNILKTRIVAIKLIKRMVKNGEI